ncbi:SDH family Clp fold serine proteinase [Winogradskyella sp.]|uniref:SDH family Clp fold serine proteinase n=1 Tax=Winogradskyella sp. TaxID=1883156 RepID=UPI003BAAA465
MASILNDYLNKGMGYHDLQKELTRLLSQYKKYTTRDLFIFSSDISKGGMPGHKVSLEQEDFYTIQDILREDGGNSIDMYLETPGGSGEAAEEIAIFLHNKFKQVNFIIASEAKSAGTILALSGDNISMTETGSLGPIDAQVKIGRYVCSAHDYKEWVENKKKEASTHGRLNPFDAIMVAQISPGELNGVINSLEFAKVLVKEWLENYKFKNWNVTRTRGIKVTPEMRKKRADEVAEKFANHTYWKTHGRSLKIKDLEDVLIIDNIDDDPNLAEIVYRIKTVIRLIYSGSSAYKMFRYKKTSILKTVTASQQTVRSRLPQPIFPAKPPNPGQKVVDAIETKTVCPKCGKIHKIQGYLDLTSAEIKKLKLPTNNNINDNDVLICDNCKFAIDLKSLKNDIERDSKRKINFK